MGVTVGGHGQTELCRDVLRHLRRMRNHRNDVPRRMQALNGGWELRGIDEGDRGTRRIVRFQRTGRPRRRCIRHTRFHPYHMSNGGGIDMAGAQQHRTMRLDTREIQTGRFDTDFALAAIENAC